MDNLHHCKAAILQFMMLHASKSLLEAPERETLSFPTEPHTSTTVPAVSASTLRKKRERVHREPYASVNELNCSALFNNVSDRIDIDREGDHLFSTWNAQPTITLQEQPRHVPMHLQTN